MKDLYPYSIENLAEMFSLTPDYINNIIRSEGVPMYSPLRQDFIGYLPSLGSAFKLDYATEILVGNNVFSKYDYNARLTPPVITVSSENPGVPATAFLFKNRWLQKTNQIMDVSNFSILVSKNIELPFYCGHEKAISRLGLISGSDVIILKVKHFLKEWK